MKLLWAALCGCIWFASLTTIAAFAPSKTTTTATLTTILQSSNNNNNNNNELEKTFGGYTAKQRLREEVESPFRTVRLWFFGVSTGSALIAFYFSALTLAKSLAGGFVDAPPVPDALSSVGINVAAIVGCGFVTYRDYQNQQKDLQRIKQGGALAKLVVEKPMLNGKRGTVATLADYRRSSRVLIAAGNVDYITTLCQSLLPSPETSSSSSSSTELTLPEAIAVADLLVVPVLMTPQNQDASTVQVGDTATCWSKVVDNLSSSNSVDDDNPDAPRVVAFPRGSTAWADVLQPEVNTALSQGFDPYQKGLTLILKKNGKILRRATGQPQWNGLLDAMNVLDGNKFGMPGDDAIYSTGLPPNA